MRGQVSTELLIIVALVLLIFIPLLVLVYFKANEATTQISSYQAELAVFRVASLANSVGSLGTNTSVTTDVFIPPNTVELRTEKSGRGGEVVLEIEEAGGTNELVEIVKFPIYDPGTLADENNAGGWMKLNISSEYEGGEARIKITKAS